jgi:hypothetical protein
MQTTVFKSMTPQAIRERLHIPIEDCAFWADVTPRTYRKWERQGFPIRRMMASVNMAARKQFDIPEIE